MIEANEFDEVARTLAIPSEAEMAKYYRGERLQAFQLGWPSVKLGLLPGNLTLVSGYGNQGKGTFIRQVSLQMFVRYQIRSVYWAPEDSPAEYFYGDLIHTWTGKSTEKHHSNYIPHDEYNTAFKEVTDMVKLIDFGDEVPTVIQILEVFTHYYKRFGCRMIVIDPFNNTSDMNAVDRDDKVVRSVCLAAKLWLKSHQDCFVVIVLHPKAPSGVKSGEDPKCPTYNDLHYGSDWSKFGDDIFMWHHPTFNSNPENNDRILSPAKIKKQKISGRKVNYNMIWKFEENRILDSDWQCGLPPIKTTPAKAEPKQTTILDQRQPDESGANPGGMKPHKGLEPIDKDDLPF